MVSVRQSAVMATRPCRRTPAGVNLVLAALSLLTLAFPTLIFAEEESTVSISILVYNYAEVAPGILASAEREANRILNRSGVRAVWFDCSGKTAKVDEEIICRSGGGYQNISLRLLARHIPNGSQDFTFGFAVLPGLASVYCEDAALLTAQQQLGSELPRLLGSLFVHEIGHLLLNSVDHSPIGVMQAHWGSKQLQQSLTGFMAFTPAQSRVMREQIKTRMSLPLDGRTPETSSVAIPPTIAENRSR